MIEMKVIEQYFRTVLFILLSVDGVSNFWICRLNPRVWPFK